MKEPMKAAEAAQADVRLEEAHAQEVPENGIKGLKHWKHDLLAGVVVSLVSLPLSSGIAIASGAPPIYGLISSIIAGLVYPMLGGSYVTISGPAAGLAPALAVTMASLGGVGTATTVGAGYHKLLVVIFLVGLFQVLIARTGLAKFAASFPASVVEGMLAAIGILILVKAIPLTLGNLHPGHPHGFLDYLAHIPGWAGHLTPSAALIGFLTLFVMLATATKRAREYKLFRVIPPHLWGVLIAIPLGAILHLKSIDPKLLIQVPANPLSGVHLPDFCAVFSDSSVWKAAALGMVTLLLIDGVESLATAQAIDRVDPYKRTSEPNRVLMAMGISNMVSSLVGGLTVIPGGVKSKTNIEAGGRTLWSNFANASMLLIFLFVAPGLISLIPTAALGGILIYTGWKMAHPAIAKHIAGIGLEQLALYIITIITTLLTDLLIGVLVGTAAKLLLLAFYARKRASLSEGKISTWKLLKGMFRDPVKEKRSQDGTLTLDINDSLVCFNAYRLREHIEHQEEGINKVVIEIGDRAAIIDHTACEAVFGCSSLLGNKELVINGLEGMEALSPHKESIHLQNERRFRHALR